MKKYTKHRIIYAIALLGIILCSHIEKAHSQVINDDAKVDTLSFAERFSIHTNAADWVILTGNIGIEFDIRNTNWNRWALGANVRYANTTDFSKTKYKPGVLWRLSEVKVYFRNYWRTHEIDEKNNYPYHKNYLDKAFSQRRLEPKHLKTTYYRGIFASYGGYNFKFGEFGYCGKEAMLGFTYGIVRPLYIYQNGNSIDLDFGIDFGACVTKHKKYRHDAHNNCYPLVKKMSKEWEITPFPMISELRAAFVYRFGDYPILSKYRRRYDVDPEFKALQDSISREKQNQALEKIRLAKEAADSIEDARIKAINAASRFAMEEPIYENDFKEREAIIRALVENEDITQEQADSLIRIERAKTDEIIRKSSSTKGGKKDGKAKKAKKEPSKEELAEKAKKAAEKEQKEKEKAAEKIAKKEAKAAAKIAAEEAEKAKEFEKSLNSKEGGKENEE